MEPKPDYEVPQPKRGRGRPRNGDYPHQRRVRLSDEQMAFIKQLAAREKISEAAAIRLAVDIARKP